MYFFNVTYKSFIQKNGVVVGRAGGDVGCALYIASWTRVLLFGGGESGAAVSSLCSEWGSVGAGWPAWGAVARAGSAWVTAERLLRNLVVLSDLQKKMRKILL